MALLRIDNLTASYRQGKGWRDAVRSVSLHIERGETYGLVGESGSGKSTLALAIMRQLPRQGEVREGRIELGGRNLLALSDGEMRGIWRERIKLMPQNPLASLNPSMRIGTQLAETLDPSSHAEARTRVLELLGAVRLADPKLIARSYPHELSGGMQQRIMIAMALGGKPDLLVLDEPTTNLDVTTEAVVLDLIKELSRDRSAAVLYVSHSLAVVGRVCDRVAVLYAGELVEDAQAGDLYHRPLHPYTQGLLDSMPRLGQNKETARLRPIAGQIPALDTLPSGCVFAPRCPLAIDRCLRERPILDEPSAGRRVRCHRWPEILAGHVSTRRDLATVSAHEAADEEPEVVLEVADLRQRFSLPRSPTELLRGKPPRKLVAVNDVNLQIRRGSTLGLVGESGSGKTTLARCVFGLVERNAGAVSLLDIPLARSLASRDRATLRRLQLVFQNPEEALNPYLTVGEILGRPLKFLTRHGSRDIDAEVVKLLAAVKLAPDYAGRTPGQLSGGEKQRVAIARAFASQPDLLVYDEPVSALDVSVQAAILNLLNDLQREQGSAYLFISHDLSVVAYVADEVAVMYLGQLLEAGRTEDVLAPPYHPYTEALLSAVPRIDSSGGATPIRLEGNIPSPADVPTGCPFHSRCPRFLGAICVNEKPPWQSGANGQRIRCHIPLEDLRRMQCPAVE
jgi:peptide/nickel transport system ATP-binding protein